MRRPSQYMEALVECRKQNRFSRYIGACNEITWDLSLCLTKEKKVVRADRQEKWVRPAFTSPN